MKQINIEFYDGILKIDGQPAAAVIDTHNKRLIISSGTTEIQQAVALLHAVKMIDWGPGESPAMEPGNPLEVEEP